VLAHGANVRIIGAPIQQSGTLGFGRQSPLQACQTEPLLDRGHLATLKALLSNGPGRTGLACAQRSRRGINYRLWH
jgi:hypothetical protein